MTSSTAVKQECAPAKVNLFLHVGARSAGGYHPLESLVVFTDFGDRLRLEPADDFALARSGPFANALPDSVADDLIVRAVVRMAELFARLPEFTITLEKNIPVAAGVGGGSADAAAAIRLVCREWAVSPDTPEVSAIAASLGADVPMCLQSGPAWVAGFGQLITPQAGVMGLDLLLVNPRVPLVTADVFGAFASPALLGGFSQPRFGFAAPAPLLSFLKTQRNDLTKPARALCPEVDDVLTMLEGKDGCRLARMSGSGPTCFGVFDDWLECERAGYAIAAARPDWWVVPSRTRPSAV